MLDGVDCSAINLAALRNVVGIIPQEPLLFSGSLRSNLDPAGVHSEDEIGTYKDNRLFVSLFTEDIVSELRCTYSLTSHCSACTGGLQPGWFIASAHRGARIKLASRLRRR